MRRTLVYVTNKPGVLQQACSESGSENRRRALRDQVMMPILMIIFVANMSVYGARKLWIAALKDGHDIGRDQVARLMRERCWDPVHVVEVGSAFGGTEGGSFCRQRGGTLNRSTNIPRTLNPL